MKRWIIGLLLLVIVLTTGGMALASDITNATYRGAVQATNSSTATTNVAVPFTANTSSWITNGILNATAMNVVAKSDTGSDVPIMPGYGSNPSILFYDAIAGSSDRDVTLYLGGTASGGKLVYFPDTAGATVPDTASIEPGNNFAIRVNDTFNDSDDIVFYKTNGIYAQNFGTSLVTAIASTSYQNCYSGTSTWGAWVEKTLPTAAWLDGFELRLYNDVGGPDTPYLYEIQIYNSLTSAWISPTSGTGTGWSNIANAYDGNTGTAATHSNIGAAAWSNYATFTTGLLYCTKIRYWAIVAAGDASDQVDVKSRNVGVYLTYARPTTEYDLELLANTTNITLKLNGVTVNSTALGGASVPNNANAWYFNGFYIGEIEIDVAGTPAASWGWQYGTTFVDTINSIVMTPTFRTTTSDADVSAALTMFSPISTATVDSSTASSWPSIMTEVPTQSPVMYTENTSPGIFFAPIVETIWPYSGLPNSFFWYCFAFTFIVGAGILVYAVFATKGYSAMLIKVIVMMAVMIFWSVPGPNIYGGYVPIYFGMWSFGILVLSKNYGW